MLFKQHLPDSFCRKQWGVSTDDFLPGEINAATNSQQAAINACSTDYF